MRPALLLQSRVLLPAAACLLLACAPRRNAPPSSGADVYSEEIQSPTERRHEIDEKVGRLVALLKEEGYSCAELSSPEDIAWITGGAKPGSVPSVPREPAPQEVIIRADGRRFALGFGPELRRLERETLGGLGFEYHAEETLDPAARGDAVFRAGLTICGGNPRPYFGSAGKAGNSTLRTPLTQGEVHKYRWLGRACAEAVEKAALTIPRYATEHGVEVLLTDALRRRDIDAVQIRVSADDRLKEHGLVLPGNGRRIERVIAIGLTARRWGLHISMSRTVSLVPVEPKMARDLENAAALVAGLWARTVPGRALEDARLSVLKEYDSLGQSEMAGRGPTGWITGYREYEVPVDPDSLATAQPGQPLVWSLTVGSVELTDTIMLVGDSFELLTASRGWPRVEAKSLGRIYRIPAVLVR